MRKKLKRLLALVMVFSMTMSLLSTTAFAEGEGTGSTIIGKDGGYFGDIDFKLFNYTGDMNVDNNQNDGINGNDVEDYFKFRGTHVGNKVSLAQNNIWDDDGYTADRVKLEGTLDKGYPVVDTSRAKELVAALKLMDTTTADAEQAKIAAAQAKIAAAQEQIDDTADDEAKSAAIKEKEKAEQEKTAAEEQLAAFNSAAELVNLYSTDSRYKSFFTDAKKAEILSRM